MWGIWRKKYLAESRTSKIFLITWNRTDMKRGYCDCKMNLVPPFFILLLIYISIALSAVGWNPIWNNTVCDPKIVSESLSDLCIRYTFICKVRHETAHIFDAGVVFYKKINIKTTFSMFTPCTKLGVWIRYNLHNIWHNHYDIKQLNNQIYIQIPNPSQRFFSEVLSHRTKAEGRAPLLRVKKSHNFYLEICPYLKFSYYSIKSSLDLFFTCTTQDFYSKFDSQFTFTLVLRHSNQ